MSSPSPVVSSMAADTVAMDNDSMDRPGSVARRETPRPAAGSAAKWLAPPPPPPNPLAQAPTALTAPVRAPPAKAMPSQRPLPSAGRAAAEVAAAPAAAAPHPQPLPKQLPYDILRQRLASPDSRHPRYDELPPPPPPPGSPPASQRTPPPPPRRWSPVPVKQKPTAAAVTTTQTPGAPQEALEAPGAKATAAPDLGRNSYRDDRERSRVKVKPPPAGFGPGHAPAGHAPLSPPVKPRPRTPPPTPQAPRTPPVKPPPRSRTMELEACQAARAAADAQQVLEDAQQKHDAAQRVARRARAAAMAAEDALDAQAVEVISDDEAQAAAAPGHEPRDDAPNPDWPHGWYGGWFKAPAFENQPEHCEIRGGGEEGPWLAATMVSMPILRRPLRSWRDRGTGHGYRLFVGGLLPPEDTYRMTGKITKQDVERWLYAAGGIDPVRPLIEYPTHIERESERETYIYIYIHIYTYTYIYIHIHTYTQVH